MTKHRSVHKRMPPVLPTCRVYLLRVALTFLRSSPCKTSSCTIYMLLPLIIVASPSTSAKLLPKSISKSCERNKRGRVMASEQDRSELDARARQGETVIPGGTGGKSLEAQEHLAEGRSRGGQTRKEQLGTEGYQEMGHKGGQTRKEQMGTEGYQEMGRKGGLSTMDKSGGERAEEEGIDIDESKFRTR